MPSIATTLVSHTSKSGNGQRGPWALHLFTDVNGVKFQTFEAPLGNRSFGLLNQPAVIEYVEEASKKLDNQGQPFPPNNVIKDIQPDIAAAQNLSPTMTPPPTVTAPTNSGDDRQIQIMRQSALKRAIRAIRVVAIGDYSYDNLYSLTEEFLHYFQTGEYPGKAEGPAKQSNEQAIIESNEQAIIDEFADVFPA